MAEILSAEDAVSVIRDGATVAIGGFGAVGAPIKLIDALVKQGTKALTIITNDTAIPGVGMGKLITTRQVARFVGTFLGSNPESVKQVQEGGIQATLIPQGTFAERLRAAGSGLGGFLTPVGVGTVVEEGKQKIDVDGKPYLLEKPLRADFALVKAHTADRLGNLVYRATARNFNPAMATAADHVIAEVGEIVEPGEIDPNVVITPFVYVDVLVKVSITHFGRLTVVE